MPQSAGEVPHLKSDLAQNCNLIRCDVVHDKGNLAQDVLEAVKGVVEAVFGKDAARDGWGNLSTFICLLKLGAVTGHPAFGGGEFCHMG